MPIVNREKCEGKAECVTVCPYNLFEIGIVSPQERATLSFVGRLGGTAHGWKQAFPVHAEACRTCAECVASCPEKAITLKRVAVT
ncbi:MAG TPA: ferredoxin family protein [Bellilinea sp.]|nr:ferredoxin family protein [Bellilinea sp.]